MTLIKRQEGNKFLVILIFQLLPYVFFLVTVYHLKFTKVSHLGNSMIIGGLWSKTSLSAVKSHVIPGAW